MPVGTTRYIPLRYSPKCLEEEFCELPLYGVLGSPLYVTSKGRPYLKGCVVLR